MKRIRGAFEFTRMVVALLAPFVALSGTAVATTAALMTGN